VFGVEVGRVEVQGWGRKMYSFGVVRRIDKLLEQNLTSYQRPTLHLTLNHDCKPDPKPKASRFPCEYLGTPGQVGL